MTAAAPEIRRPGIVGGRPAGAGAVGGIALLGWYLGLIALAQGPAHALEQFESDAPFVLAVTLGFGTQIALFLELRRMAAGQWRGAAVTAASTGTSTAAMLACCAHHFADVLPLVGVSVAAVFIDKFKLPLLVLGLAMNALGVAVLWRELSRARAACAIADHAA